MSRPINVRIEIASDLDTVWRLTQDPGLHQRWDLRFTDIEYLPKTSPEAPQRFRYATRLGFGLTVEGWGESVATRHGEHDGISSLRFGSESPLSLIRAGSGYWKYGESAGGVAFETGYDYQTRFGLAGRAFDAAVFRPLIGWATAWSFDRLRLWIEEGIDPALSAARSLTHAVTRIALAAVMVLHGLIPKILLRHPEELRLVEGVGIPESLAPIALITAGAIEMAWGIGLIVLWRARWMYTLTAAGLLMLLVLALVADPTVATDPFNPITFTIALLALCAAAWAACRNLPSAGRCRRRPAGSTEEALA